MDSPRTCIMIDLGLYFNGPKLFLELEIRLDYINDRPNYV